MRLIAESGEFDCLSRKLSDFGGQQVVMNSACEGEMVSWIEGAVDLVVAIEGNAAGMLESTELPDHGEDQGLGHLSLGRA